MSFRSSIWRSSSYRSQIRATSTKAPSTMLEFYSAFASSGLKVWNSNDLSLLTRQPRRAGHGSFAFVEIGETPDKKPIIVKKSLKLEDSQYIDQSDAFTKHFKQLCLELRILTHCRLKGHKNIVDLLGICADDYSGVPSITLVLECATFGTLDVHLASSQVTNEEEKMRCAFQVSNGLDALHRYMICHGDVKTRNILVFSVSGRWDFGNSVLSTSPGIKEGVQIPHGTPLYNAPEIRRLKSAAQSAFTIEDALLTDVFSFGLLVLELLNQGACFYSHMYRKSPQDLRVENMVEVLTQLPHNQLLRCGLASLENKHLPRHIKDCLADTLRGSLQDSPLERYSMNRLRMLLQVHDGLESSETDKQDITETEQLASWADERTLHEMLDLFFITAYST